MTDRDHPPRLLDGQRVVLDARHLPYRALDARLRELVSQGARNILLRGVMGQRYVGTNLRAQVRLTIEGVPGNDLGSFMDGPTIEVLGPAQDGCGNTMNSGTIIVHGSAGHPSATRAGARCLCGTMGYRRHP